MKSYVHFDALEKFGRGQLGCYVFNTSTIVLPGIDHFLRILIREPGYIVGHKCNESDWVGQHWDGEKRVSGGPGTQNGTVDVLISL